MIEAVLTVYVVFKGPYLENLLELPDAVILPIITPVLPLRLPHGLCLLRVGLDPILLLLSILLLELLKLRLKLSTLLQFGKLEIVFFSGRKANLLVNVIRGESHVWTSQTVSDQLEHIMVVRQTSCGRRNSKVSILWQDNVLRADTHLKVLFVVGHPVVEENSQGVLEVLNLGSHLTIWC